MLSRKTVSAGWEFTQTPSEIIPDVKVAWTSCTKVPTSVHVELIAQKKIPHPYKGLAEWDVQWVQEADWAFRTTFSIGNDELDKPEKDLVFEGLDTYCDIYLNGKHLQYTDNMYTSYRISVKDVIKKDNELLLKFKSPHVESRREMNANGGPRMFWNGQPERLFSRKSGYHWGWDWGPVIMCTGPWRPIHFEAYRYRFTDVRIDTTLVGPSYDIATLIGTLNIGPQLPSPAQDHRLIVTLTEKRTGQVTKQSVQVYDNDPLDWKFDKGEVEVWWPVGYGKQPLYDLEITLVDKSGKELSTSHTRVAFRDAQVVQDKLDDQEGSTFLFQINGVRIFCGGSNWIPADNFFTEIEKDRYRRWAEMLVEGNQNMLRVWGGGIYEEEELYDACDELGILVWQDFMFGCGFYPSYKEINQSIKVEAEQAVTRLRRHPSVVIFAGNNEDYQLAEGIPGAVDYWDESGNYLNGPMPSRHIYEVLLPEVVHRLSNIFYWRSSPYGGKKTVADPTVGDIHQWNVWHGTQEPWSSWDKLAGRFVSEFGMQGYPNMRTVKEWIDDAQQLFPQSRVSVNHNKADGFERRIELYLAENFRHAYDMPSYIYYTQVMQAECLSAAYRLWRRNWKGRGKEYTAGALVWQINDCWPCVSWAIADYYLRPKPAYFAIARELRPYTVGMARKDIKTPTRDNSLAFFEVHQELQLWGCNSTLTRKRAKVELVSFDLDDGEVDRRSFDVELASNASTEIWTGDVPGQSVRTSFGQVPRPIVCQARLVDTNGDVLARYSNWPEPWKYLLFPDPKLEIRVAGDEITLSCEKPIKGIILDTEAEECKWSDQAIDLFPGDAQTVVAEGLKGRKVSARYLGDGSA